MKSFDKKEKSDCSASDDSPPQRPKRNTCQKSAGVTNGLLWREETDLKKALYASLQENKRRNWEEEDGEENPDEEEQSLPAEGVVENGVEESPKKAKVHAQRKFAQGSTPSSPVLTPQKIPSVNNSTTQLLPYKRPKTEDFLTFLCLRGTSILPPSLDFLNSCSKSDTSSDCRSLSPELQEYNSKETNSKNTDAREKSNLKHEGGENGLPHKIGACRASSKRYPEGPPIKRLNFANSKFNKVGLPSKKRKLQDENDDPSRMKSNLNSKVKSTGLKALKEKYKKQRLAADKKKLLPAKSSNSSSVSKKITVTQKSQSNAKLPTVPSKNVSKKQVKVNAAITHKPKLSKVEKKLAVEKRKSLRSADVRPRRLAALRKKTPWLRRAKLVPPIVDVESDSSEPEIIHTTPVKKVPVAAPSQKKASKPENVSDRLRSKQVTSKAKNRLTSRQILLRKHMQNRLKAKKSILHTKNIRSREIIKRTTKQAILKKVKKNIVMKTMSLRKDLQNKRVTRSAKHQIEEMLWSNPEKRSRVQNQKQVASSKSEKKKSSNENQSAISKKPKSAVVVKGKERAKVSKITKDSLKRKSHSTSPNEKAAKPSAGSRVSESAANPSKISRRSLSRDEKLASSSTAKSHSSSSSSSKTANHHSASSNVTKAVNNNSGSSSTTKTANHTSGSSNTTKAANSCSGPSGTAKTGIHHSESSSITKTSGTSSGSSSTTKTVSHHQKPNGENSATSSETKSSKPSFHNDSKRESKITSNNIQEQNKTVAEFTSEASLSISKISKIADEGNKSNSSAINNELNKVNAKVNLEKEPFVKLDANEKDSSFWNVPNSNLSGSDKNVQNNLNLLEPEKSSNKDISNLIVLNVNCEETSYTQNVDPCCSGISQMKEKNVNKVKDSKCDSKEVNVKHDIKIHKKNHDKKSVKKSISKEDKMLKHNSDRDKSTKKSEKGEIKSPKKHSSKERRSSKEVDVNNDIKKSNHKKETSKHKAENELDNRDLKKIPVKSNNEKKNNIKEKTIFDNLESKHSEKSHKKDNFRERSPSVKSNKQNSDENKSLVPVKDLNSSDDKGSNDDVFNVKHSDCLPMDVDKKVENDVRQPSCSKDYSRNVINSSSSGITNRETDDDSDYDLTLDQFIKLNALKAAEKSGSGNASPAKGESSSNIKNVASENKDPKSGKKDSDKDVQKHKKDGESSKHKKDKDGSKSKSHDKDQKTPKKDDKGSKKDSEKSLAKLLKKEKEKLKSNKKEEKSKHKKDSSSKSSKKDGEKDISKLIKKESEDSSVLSSLGESGLEHSENKKEKTKKEFKLSRSSSCDETKSPKKKKKHNEFKDIEKIKNLISKSSILSEFSGFKEFKRRSSSDKSELKKSKKRKKLALLKEKKLSKKISSKLLRKYSKKKGLKSKKNKLKKKELKEMKIADLENKILSKSKKQKHKVKNDHHGKEDKAKNIEVSVSATASKSIEISSTSGTAQFFAKVTESQCISFSNTTSDVIISNPSTCSSTASTVTGSVPTYIIESVPEVIPPIDTMTNQISQPIAAPSEQYVFGSADELQGIVTSDFTGVFDETFPTGTILLATRDTISQVPLHFIQDISVPKTMADAATNTGEDDIEENLEVAPEVPKSDEMSVGTQTITPTGSPSPTVEIQPLVLPQTVEAVVESSNSKKESINPVPSVSLIKTPDKTLPALVTPTKPATSNATSDVASPSPKAKRRSSFHKKSKTHSILLPKGQPFPVDSAKMVAAPVYYPTVEEFRDPLEYIYKIQGEAAQFGICKIVPPSSFKPECKVNDDMRFTAHNQYVHKMLHRWGPNVKHTACIKKHLKSQKVKLEQAPLIGGIELDISRFYHTVQQYGGLQQVIEKKKWQRVADTLRVPKTAQDRVTKLYDAYCKYLVSYDTLPIEEKEKLEKEVIADHEKRVKLRSSAKVLEKEEEELDDEENTDCVSKGRSMSLSNFFRIARNTMNMWFKNAPSPDEVEHEYWKIVTESQHHVVVHAGNIDSSVYQSGFPCNRNSPFAKHPWNLKILTNNSSSILRCMGPVSGITIPTLHVGMLFTTGCWYRDPHSLPWIEYLHTGASKIWYSIPAKGCEKFRESMKKNMPEYCTNNPIWLPSDTAMVPPELLVKHGASLSRTIQNSGQFVVIFPESFTSTICCGYCVSESVYFAPASWLDLAVKAFQDIQSSCESPAFSLERLLFGIANDPKTHPETLQKILPLIQNIRAREIQLRSQVSESGLKQCERLPLLDTKDKKKKSRIEDECEQECEVCRAHCYVSMVIYSQEDTIYCLPHALEYIPKKNLKLCKLMYTYDENELKELETKIVELIGIHLAKLSVKKKSPKKKLTSAPEK